MNKNDCTDYLTELLPVDCTTDCCGVTGKFISNYPEITRMYPARFPAGTEYNQLTATTGSVVLEGYNFNNTTGVYLSSNNNAALATLAAFSTPLSTFDIYSHLPGVSATFLPFTGYKLRTFDLVNNNHIQITIPEIPVPMIINVILTNPIGHNIPFILQSRHRIRIA